MTDADTTLLRRYADQGDEAAFAELVRRHLDLVYGAALRRTSDAHHAADVAQQVFTQLARHARQLAGHAVLSAWLHTATRNAALNLMISDQRRKARDAEALALDTAAASGAPEPAWEQVRPLLDEAIDELPEADRAAVVLRYLERREFADIGARLNLSADAARMRAERALEKLRAALARRGVKSTGAALAAVFANQVTAAAPAGLAASITGTALASAAAGTTFIMSTSTAILTAVALVATGATVYQWTHAQRAEAELAALIVDRDSLRSQLSAEQQRATRSAKNVATLQSEVDSLKAKQVALAAPPRPAAPPPQVAALPELKPEQLAQIRRASMDKAIFNNLRQFSAARSAFQQRYGRPAGSLDELVGEGKFIRKLTAVDGENYATLPLDPSQPLVVTNSDGGTVTYDPSAAPSSAPPRELSPEEQRVRDMAQRLKPAIGQATEAYRAAHNGVSPTDPNALVPYFATPQEGADYVELLGVINAGPGRVK